jgi:hypothetical protein
VVVAVDEEGTLELGPEIFDCLKWTRVESTMFNNTQIGSMVTFNNTWIGSPWYFIVVLS